MCFMPVSLDLELATSVRPPRPRTGWAFPILAHEATASAQYAQSTVLPSATELLRVPAEGRAVKEGRVPDIRHVYPFYQPSDN